MLRCSSEATFAGVAVVAPNHGYYVAGKRLSSHLRRQHTLTSLNRHGDVCRWTHTHTHNSFGDRCFASAGPRSWKTLSTHLDSATVNGGAWNFHLRSTAQSAQKVWRRTSPVGFIDKAPDESGGWSPQKLKQFALCRHCLVMLTSETIKSRKFRTIHLPILDQLVLRWGLSDILRGLHLLRPCLVPLLVTVSDSLNGCWRLIYVVHATTQPCDVFVMACSHRRRGRDKTDSSRRVGDVNTPLKNVV